MKRLLACAFIGALVLAVAAPAALAFDCYVANKPPTAGAPVLVNIVTGEETVLKPNPGTEEKPHGGFVALTDGESSFSPSSMRPRRAAPGARGRTAGELRRQGSRLA